MIMIILDIVVGIWIACKIIEIIYQIKDLILERNCTSRTKGE